MKEQLYRQLVEVIHRKRTWCTVIDADSEGSFSQQVNGELTFMRCRQLTLAALHPYGAYSKGHTWNIPMYRLDKAVSWLKQHNPSFKTRCKSCSITMEDAESIIAHTSYDLIHLDLQNIS